MYLSEESIIEQVLKGDINARVPERRFPPGAARRAQAINRLINKYGEALRKKDEAAALFNENPVPIVRYDEKFNILMVNPAFLECSGYSKDKVTAMNAHDFKVTKAEGHGIKEAVRTKQRAFGRMEIEMPSGKKVLDAYTIPLLNKEGNIRGFMGVYVDVTQIVKGQRYMEHEVERLIATYGLIAQGDISAQYLLTEPDKDTRATYEQVARLHEAVSGIVANLEENVRDVNMRMEELTRRAEQAAARIRDASEGIQEIARNTGKVSENSENASRSVDGILKAVSDMSSAIQDITTNMDNAASLSAKANELSYAGARLAKNVETSMKDIAGSSGRVSEIVTHIDGRMGEITAIVDVITDISSQTNMLALNAAIEAARAGDAGRGFAVVAEEVKSLADESRLSADKITKMIAGFREESRKASQAMVESSAMVSQGNTMVKETLTAFSQIAQAVEAVAKSVADVAATTEEQAATTQEITASISEVAQMVEKTSKEAGESAASTQQSSAAIDEISRMITEVSVVSREAMEVNQRFKVS